MKYVSEVPLFSEVIFDRFLIQKDAKSTPLKRGASGV